MGTARRFKIAAGGKLYNAVVEDERVGKDLLESGGIRETRDAYPAPCV